LTLLVRTTDVDRAWTLHVSGDPVVTTTGTRLQQEARGIPDVVWEGTAIGLYLAVWNRGDEVTESGDRPFLARWRKDHRVTWA
jgi:hypothetical protein